jgi:hypothetical protein
MSRKQETPEGQNDEIGPRGTTQPDNCKKVRRGGALEGGNRCVQVA